MSLSSTEFWVALAQIIGVNIVLSGDNAIVIALAARGLPGRQQSRAVAWGSGAAVVMRIVLTVVAVELLRLPWLKLIGAVMVGARSAAEWQDALAMVQQPIPPAFWGDLRAAGLLPALAPTP